MNRTRALQLLAQHKAQLAEQFGVTRLALFGSTVRDAAREDSDVDVLVAFDGAATSKRYFKPFLAHALHPDIRAWLDPARFATFRLEYGELVWGDYDLCFPVIDLYRNQIEHSASLEPWLEHHIQRELVPFGCRTRGKSVMMAGLRPTQAGTEKF